VNNALYGSFLPIPSADLFPMAESDDKVTPGALVTLKTPIVLNKNSKRWHLRVHNTGDRPIQVGSHYPFLETNPSLVFDRLLSYGTRLDIAAGTAVRFEPGETKTVTIVQVGGNRVLAGGSAIGEGPFAEEKRLTQVKERVESLGFGHVAQESAELGPDAAPKMDREVVSH
jgi:urease